MLNDSLIHDLRAAGQGMTAADLQRAPSGGGFSLVEHACHLHDYETACLERILRMLVEDAPFLDDFAGERIAIERGYRTQSFSAAVEDFALRRATTLRILQALPAEQWQRAATLGSAGCVTVRGLVEIIAAHDRTHRREIEGLIGETGAADIEALREMAREFAAGFNTGDPDRMMRFYGASYVDVNLRVPVQSHAERRAYFASLMRQGGFRVAVHPDEIEVHGPFAF